LALRNALLDILKKNVIRWNCLILIVVTFDAIKDERIRWELKVFRLDEPYNLRVEIPIMLDKIKNTPLNVI
jgi:hypothetical protein